jgi:Flp pilus assembly secretin CpaC
MRALFLLIGMSTLQFCGAATTAQETDSPHDRPVLSCPAVLPVIAGERSIVVPTVATEAMPHVASRPVEVTIALQRELLTQKLAERDRLQREITELRAATKTPEQILVRVKMMEVNRTKIRHAGVRLSAVDSANSQPLDLSSLLLGERSAPAAAMPKYPSAGVVSFRHVAIQNPALAGMLNQLEQQGLARTIAEPAMVVLDSRPASLKVGGEFPIPPVADGGEATSKDFGTQFEVTATILGDDQVRLALHPRVTEIDESQGIVVNGRNVPALRVREADFNCNVEFGRSILAVGLEQERRIQKASWGGLRQQDEIEQIALLIVATPEIVR